MKKPKEPLLFCRVNQECAGIKKPKFSGQKVRYQKYSVGDKVKGYEHNASDIPTAYIPSIRTIDGYIINTTNLTVIGEEHEATVLKDIDLVSDKLKARFNRFANITGGASGIVEAQKKQTKYMLNGALTGGIITFIYALAKGSNKTGYFIFGAIVGGMVGKYYGGQKDE